MKIRSFVALAAIGAVLCVSAPLPSAASEEPEVLDLTLSGLIPQEMLEANGHVALTDSFHDNLYMVEYENEDDTRTVYCFSSPVKYRTDDGEVAYIDTSLETTNLWENMQGYAYKNETNAFSQYFPKKSTGELLTECAQFSIEQRICADEEEAALSGTFSTAQAVEYAAQETDAPAYTYSPTASGSRGQVSFDALPQDNVVKVALSGEEITSLSEEEGMVCVNTADGTAMTLMGEGLYDANGAWIQDGEVSFVKQGNTYYVSYELDGEAIPEDAAYPLSFSYASNVNTEVVYAAEENVAVALAADTDTNSGCAINDTMVYEGLPTKNYSSNSVLYLSGGSGSARRIYTKFDLSALSGIRYDRVLSARYSIYQYYNYTYTNEEHFDVELHQVSESYDTSTVTWNTKPDHFDEMIAGESIVPVDDIYVKRYHFMVTSLVQGWLQGIDNNGIVLLMRDESETTSTTRRFPSSSYTNEIGPTFTVTYTSDTTTSDNIGIEAGAQYYIKCKGSVMGISGATEAQYLTAPSTSSGYVTLQPFAASSAQKWTVVSYGSGYYYLQPANLSGYVLYTPNSGSYYKMQLSTKTANTKKIFKFQRNWDGSYHIVSYAGGGDDGLWTSSATAGAYVYHGINYVDMDFLDDWTLEKVSKGTANVFCFTEAAAYGEGRKLDTKYYVDGGGTLQYGPRIDSSGYELLVKENASAESGRDALGIQSLECSDIWIFSGHGGLSGVEFATTSQTSYLSTSAGQGYSNQYPIDVYGKGSFSQLRYAIMQACGTGNDDFYNQTTYSLVGSMYHKGAHFVQAYTSTTSTIGDVWMQYFWKKAEAGTTIAEAIEYADDQFSSDSAADTSSFLYNRHILGDAAMCLNPQV